MLDVEKIDQDTVSVLDVDASLVPADSANKATRTYIRVLQGRANDPSWMSPRSWSLCSSLIGRSEMIIQTERLSPDLRGARLPFQKFTLVAGGFSILIDGRFIEPDWHAMQKRRVSRDRAMFLDAIHETHRSLGEVAFRMNILEQNGLTYGIALPAEIAGHPEVRGFLTRIPALKTMRWVHGARFSVLRRRHIGFAPAINYLREAYPALHHRPFLKLDVATGRAEGIKVPREKAA